MASMNERAAAASPQRETPPQGRRRAGDTLTGGVNTIIFVFCSHFVKPTPHKDFV